MKFDPKEFIKVSRYLNGGGTEAHYRSIINRAYYGVFGYLRESLSVNSTGLSVHQNVIDALKHSNNINERKLSKRLETLFKKRKDADYKYHAPVNTYLCEFCLKEAEEILRLYDGSVVK